MVANFMGMFGGAAAQAAAEEAQRRIALANLKKGKTKEQKEVIDFFFDDVNDKNGCGCCGCLGKSKKVISMDEYQQRVAERCNSYNFKAKAIEKIGLDESEISEIPPLCLASYIYGDDDVYIQIQNGVAVSSQYHVTWLFFSRTQIYTYSFTFDMTSDNTWEYTKDFFYQDITCFTTTTTLHEVIKDEPDTGCIFKKAGTYKENYVVDKMIITVPGEEYSVSMRDAAGTQKQSIMAAKAMLRERKFVK